MKRPFKLIRDQVSHDTVEALEQLLTAAKSGEVIGITFAAMLRERSYIVNSCGEAYRNPTFSLGMCQVLQDELVQRVRGFNA